MSYDCLLTAAGSRSAAGWRLSDADIILHSDAPPNTSRTDTCSLHYSKQHKLYRRHVSGLNRRLNRPEVLQCPHTHCSSAATPRARKPCTIVHSVAAAGPTFPPHTACHLAGSSRRSTPAQEPSAALSIRHYRHLSAASHFASPCRTSRSRASYQSHLAALPSWCCPPPEPAAHASERHQPPPAAAAYQKYLAAVRGAIMVLFSMVSVKYLTSRCSLSSKMRMDATLPQR